MPTTTSNFLLTGKKFTNKRKKMGYVHLINAYTAKLYTDIKNGYAPNLIKNIIEEIEAYKHINEKVKKATQQGHYTTYFAIDDLMYNYYGNKIEPSLIGPVMKEIIRKYRTLGYEIQERSRTTHILWNDPQ